MTIIHTCKTKKHESFVVIRDDRVRIDRAILKGEDTIVFLASGQSGMYYTKEGKRTYLFAFPTEFDPALDRFIFRTRSEIESFLSDLPKLREVLEK